MLPNSLVRVRNLSTDSTEEFVQDYFSFCGDIRSLKLTVSEDGRSKEAEIQFESEAAASTAVLLSNAFVGERNILVELIRPAGGETAYSSCGASTTSFGQESVSESTRSGKVLSEIAGQARSVASSVSSATKELNSKYDITGKLKGAYQSAATTTSSTFGKLDEQYRLREQSSKALSATKAGISSMYRQVSGIWKGGDGSSNDGSSNDGSSTNGQQPQ